MPVNILPSQTLNDLPYGIQHQLGQMLDSVWRDLVAVMSNEKNFKFKDYEIEEIAKEAYRCDGSPSRTLLLRLGVRAMTVRELCRYLDALHLERPLRLLQDPKPLQIIKEPENVCTQVGLSFELTCRAEGFPYPQYQWFRGSIRLDGATKETVIIASASTHDAGKYICRVHNSLTVKNPEWSRWCLVTVGSDMSAKQLVPEERSETVYRRVPHHPGVECSDVGKQRTGLYAPEVVEHPADDIQVTYGNPLHLRCRAVGNPVPTFQWRKNGKALPGKNHHDLTIPSCRLDDKGTYECVVANCHGETTSQPALVSVHDVATDVPEITAFYEENMSVREGMVMELRVEVKCAVRCHFQWYFNHQVIPFACQQKYTFPAKKSDAGVYQCIVTPEKGRPVPSQSTKITVTEQPVHRPPGKVALLIGISSYRNYKELPAAKADILKFQSILKEMGFFVLTLLDLDRKEMVNSISLFCFLLQQHMYGVIYFVGHGFEDDAQQCWLVPCDAHHGCTNVKDCVSADYIIQCIQEKNPDLCVMILDICREKPNQPIKERYHFPVKAKGNLCVYYATSRGQKAYEEADGREGIFMQNLSKVLDPHQRISLLDLFEKLTEALGEDAQAAQGQIPELRINLRHMKRTLHDPTNTDGHTTSMDKMLQIWRNSQRCPDNRQLQFGDHKVTIRYEAVVSNVLKLIIHGSPRAGDSYWQLRGVEVPPEIVGKVPVQDPGRNVYEVELSQLQKIKEPVTIVITVVARGPHGREEKLSRKLDLGTPLVGAANLWRTLQDEDDTSRGSSETKPKRPHEHDESA